MVEPVTVSVPSLLMPPPTEAKLLSMVESVTVSVPSLSIPPPDWLVMPPEMVSPESEAVTPAEISSTPTALLPLIVTMLAPGPSISSGPAVSVSSSVLASLTVCGWIELKIVGVELDHAPGSICVGVGLGDAVEQVARAVGSRAGIARQVDEIAGGVARFEGPDVHGVVDDPREAEAALVGGQRVKIGIDGERVTAGVNGGTAGQEGDRLSWAAIPLEPFGIEPRVGDADLVTVAAICQAA